MFRRTFEQKTFVLEKKKNFSERLVFLSPFFVEVAPLLSLKKNKSRAGRGPSSGSKARASECGQIQIRIVITSQYLCIILIVEKQGTELGLI